MYDWAHIHLRLGVTQKQFKGIIKRPLNIRESDYYLMAGKRRDIIIYNRESVLHNREYKPNHLQ